MPISGPWNSVANKDMLSKIWTNGDTIIWLNRKHCGKRRNCSLRAISLFPTMFSNAVCCWCIKMSKGLTPFQQYFSYIVVASAPIHAFLLEFFLTSTPHNIPSKPLAAFLHNNCRNKGWRWERNESCCNDYHQSNATNWAIGLGFNDCEEDG